MISDIEKAKHEAEQFVPEAARWEAEFQDLKRREPSVLASCIESYRYKLDYEISQGVRREIKGEEQSYQWAKNSALQDDNYLFHLDQMKQAQARYLAAEKAFRTIIEYLKAITSENYKEVAKFKAGIL